MQSYSVILRRSAQGAWSMQSGMPDKQTPSFRAEAEGREPKSITPGLLRAPSKRVAMQQG